MNAEEFSKYMLDNADRDYGLCCPPLNSTKALDILISHFLGDDWYVVLSVSREQINTEAVYTILKKYPKRNGILRRLFGK